MVTDNSFKCIVFHIYIRNQNDASIEKNEKTIITSENCRNGFLCLFFLQ